jgi:hypothetical protein
MNIRCAFCQTPYTLGRTEKLIALQHMDTENLSHYDAHCPRCRKATPVERQKMEATFPNWRDALHELEVQAEATPASAPKPKPAATPKAEAKPEHTSAKARSRAGSKAKAAPQPVAKPAPKKKTATKKSA